ncbi:MAG: GtrA family protein [Curvibacter sp.]|nr:GtrA family protein [Curvibacter sp.]
MIWTSRQSLRLVRQGLIGALCFGLNLFLMWTLVAILKLDIFIATTICFFVFNALGHHLSRTFVFYDALNRYEQSLIRFLAVMATNLALNLVFMAIAVKLFGLYYLFASAGIAACFFIVNYLIHCRWTFR